MSKYVHVIYINRLSQLVTASITYISFHSGHRHGLVKRQQLISECDGLTRLQRRQEHGVGCVDVSAVIIIIVIFAIRAHSVTSQTMIYNKAID